MRISDYARRRYVEFGSPKPPVCPHCWHDGVATSYGSPPNRVWHCDKCKKTHPYPSKREIIIALLKELDESQQTFCGEFCTGQPDCPFCRATP
jgi:hypothetical protein